jgi:hypothetical protein
MMNNCQLITNIFAVKGTWTLYIDKWVPLVLGLGGEGLKKLKNKKKEPILYQTNPRLS